MRIYDEANTTNASLQPFKYNEKELDMMHGLNTYDYGARQYYSALPVWDRVDPLAEKYGPTSPYVYCLNDPIKHIDPDGKAPGDFFKTIREAAIDFGKFYNDNSIREDREYGSSIFAVTNKDGIKGYSYTIPNVGKSDEVFVSTPDFSYKVVADIHTHGAYSEEHYNNEFSGTRTNKELKLISTDAQRKNVPNGDLGDSNKLKLPSFLVTPNGSLQQYNPRTGQIRIISNDMPSDHRDPDRLNTVGTEETKPFNAAAKMAVYRKITYHNW